MKSALQAAGFPGVEEEAPGILHARLSASGAAFRADRGPEGWRLSLCWPLRATGGQRQAFMAAHPGAVMDIWQGETRVSLFLSDPPDPQDLVRWAALAEAAVIAMVGWRRAQRAPGEGM
jgi:hypothetical protein